jgi:hypothetical protein
MLIASRVGDSSSCKSQWQKRLHVCEVIDAREVRSKSISSPYLYSTREMIGFTRSHANGLALSMQATRLEYRLLESRSRNEMPTTKQCSHVLGQLLLWYKSLPKLIPRLCLSSKGLSFSACDAWNLQGQPDNKHAFVRHMGGWTAEDSKFEIIVPID